MAREIERKFLVKNDGWKKFAGEPRSYRQGYLSETDKTCTRIRIIDDMIGLMTIKSREPSMQRDEFEYKIPIAEANQLIALAISPILEKTRYKIPINDGLFWEIDVFKNGKLGGLIIAELEIPTQDHEFEIPEWLGFEVTHNPNYYNSALAQRC